MTSSSLRGARLFARAIAGFLLLAAAVVNPWTVRLWEGDRALNFRDAFRSSFALALGVVCCSSSWPL